MILDVLFDRRIVCNTLHILNLENFAWEKNIPLHIEQQLKKKMFSFSELHILMVLYLILFFKWIIDGEKTNYVFSIVYGEQMVCVNFSPIPMTKNIKY